MLSVWVRRSLATVALLGIGAGLFVSPARADAIDGDWCFGTLALTIRGPDIKTPGGTAMTGTYGRHDFSYVVPANEPGAGGTVEMQLMGDELMILRRKLGTTESPSENWRRCRPTS